MLRAAAEYLDREPEATPRAGAGTDVEPEPDARARRGPVTVEAWASRRTAGPGDEVEVALRVSIADGWHINAHQPIGEDLLPTELEAAEDARFRADADHLP
jgi:DsbC/DsbD-like thiol-disulfide interchange protein